MVFEVITPIAVGKVIRTETDPQGVHDITATRATNIPGDGNAVLPSDFQAGEKALECWMLIIVWLAFKLPHNETPIGQCTHVADVLPGRSGMLHERFALHYRAAHA